MGGDCNGSAFVAKFFACNIFGECTSCNLREEGEDQDGRRITCQVLEGLEPYLQCPALLEWLRYEGVRYNNGK